MDDSEFSQDTVSLSQPSQSCARDRAWRKANDHRAQQRQRRIAVGFQLISPAQEPLPGWRKEKALKCKANCGHCRNPRFNHTVSGDAKLTRAERRIAEDFNYTMSTLERDDFKQSNDEGADLKAA